LSDEDLAFTTINVRDWHHQGGSQSSIARNKSMDSGEAELQQRPPEEPDFFVNELRRASKEQLFGVIGVGAVTASNPPSSPGATVVVELLEQRSIKIKLSLVGYRVISSGSATRGRIFETIEDLLQEESPQWSAKRVDALILKLTEVADRMMMKR